MFEKILVGIDDTESSRTIFDRSLVLAKANRFSKGEATPTALMLVHVLTIVDNLYPGDTFIGISESAMQAYAKRLEIRERDGIEKLRSLASEAIAAGIPTEFTQNIGDPGKLICEIATNWNANLIVIGRRGLSGLSELFMGSTSNYVLHHAPCNVSIIQGTTLSSQPIETAQTLVGSVRS
jgi:nucleotide-binding universal stress UspA family protein